MFSKKWFSILLVVLMVSLMAGAVYAGDGDGSGGGQDVGLALEASVPKNGAVDIAADAPIVLTFNKNVVNMSVRDTNKNLISLLDAESNPVSVEVVMADDQIEPDKKREVIIQPTDALAAGSSYTVVIGSGFTSKSGDTLAGDVTLTFTTAADITASAADLPKTSALPQTSMVLTGLFLTAVGFAARTRNKQR